MTEDEFQREVKRARENDDMERMRELEHLESEGRVGQSDDAPATADEAFDREVQRAKRRGDLERMAELEQMEVEGRKEDAAATSGDMNTRLGAELEAARERGDTSFARQLESIQDADDPAEALSNALAASTGEEYQTLKEIQSAL